MGETQLEEHSCCSLDTSNDDEDDSGDIDIDWHWQRLDDDLTKFIHEYDSYMKVNQRNVMRFWHRFIHKFPTNKNVDMKYYTDVQEAILSSYILCAHFLLGGSTYEAVYMIFYVALMKDNMERGPDYMKGKFNLGLPAGNLKSISIGCSHLRNAVCTTRSQKKMVEYLWECLPTVDIDVGVQKCFTSILQKLGEGTLIDPEEPLHSLDIVRYIPDALVEKVFQTAYSGCPLRMDITIVNLDSGREYKKQVYPDTELGWLVHMYIIECNCCPSMHCPKVSKSTKYFRVLHRGGTFYLSSSGKTILSELGIKSGDKIMVGGLASRCNGDESKAADPVKQRVTTNKKRYTAKGTRRRKNEKTPSAHIIISEEQIVKKYRQEHSNAMTPVFDEMGPLLKSIRNRLNNLVIQKSAPKVKRLKARNKMGTPKVRPSSIITFKDDCLGGKAGKIAYPIVVGEVGNLYKTHKPSSRSILTVDLHGCSKEEALETLDGNLVLWVDTAMKGEYPWVLPVDIICGGGSQILSDAVKDWIRSHSQVANRPKGFV